MVGELTAVSLFAGVGGFDFALESNGVKVVASVEWDKKAQEVLRRHFPSSTIFGDISGVTGEQLIQAGFNPKRGIITGGFPCQDLSVAGKRAGLQGSRSGLFWEIVRLLTETKAENFILENVPGLLSSNGGAGMATVITALDDIGFDVAWRVLDAQHFGVPQRRRRVFIVGCLRGSGGTPAEILALSEGRARYLEASKQTRKGSASTASDSIGAFSESSFGQFRDDKNSATIKASGGVLGGGERNIINSLTVSDLTKGMGSNQAVNSGLLQVVDVVD